MKKLRIISSTIFILFAVASCSSKNEWSCPLPESGKSCRSINAADNGNDFSLGKKQNIKDNKIKKDILLNTITGINMDDLKPVRTPEVIGKILITPYVDEYGNLNSGKFIYTIDENPEWQFN
jgi:hypothetical protein